MGFSGGAAGKPRLRPPPRALPLRLLGRGAHAPNAIREKGGSAGGRLSEEGSLSWKACAHRVDGRPKGEGGGGEGGGVTLIDGKSRNASRRVRGGCSEADTVASGTFSRCVLIQVVIIEMGTGGSRCVGAGYSGSISSRRAAYKMVRARFCGRPKVPETHTPMRTCGADANQRPDAGKLSPVGGIARAVHESATSSRACPPPPAAESTLWRPRSLRLPSQVEVTD